MQSRRPRRRGCVLPARVRLRAAAIALGERLGLERVDVLKGPTSVLYGQNAPGGLVNLVSKRPTDEAFHELTLLGGSFASRITSNIREQKGYTYSPNSTITAQPISATATARTRRASTSAAPGAGPTRRARRARRGGRAAAAWRS